jgi:hypothetical protein
MVAEQHLIMDRPLPILATIESICFEELAISGYTQQFSLIHFFGEMSSGLMKQKWNCLAIKTIVMFGGKMGRLASRRTPSQP